MESRRPRSLVAAFRLQDSEFRAELVALISRWGANRPRHSNAWKADLAAAGYEWQIARNGHLVFDAKPAWNRLNCLDRPSPSQATIAPPK